MADYSPTRIPDSVKERFWAKVDVRGLDECWEWQGCRDPKGYGRIGFFIDRKHKVYVTSRFSLMLKAGWHTQAKPMARQVAQAEAVQIS